MENDKLKILLENVKRYINDDCQLELITKAYYCAANLHADQKRESGEEYIVHPFSVAFILSDMYADANTIAAALLHDTIEDAEIPKKVLADLFNQDIANLVDGVTKISGLNFSNKREANATNTRRIITSINEDVRIIIIKLADRLHNMRTLQFKSEFKQKENALETMEIFVPLAYNIGAYRLKSELEDLAFKYLKPSEYIGIEDELQKINRDTKPAVEEMLKDISNMLHDEAIPHDIKIRTKNIYGIYNKLVLQKRMIDMHDLIALKVMVDDVKSCYYALGIIHSKYPPINNKFKDYIAMPKTNMYQSLHTTVFGIDGHLVQTQIRTFAMDKIASFGLTSYWDLNRDNAKKTMQEDLKTKYQFFKSITDLNSMTSDNQEFVSHVKKELFASNIYVYTPKGDTIELPEGSTPIDFAYKIDAEIGNKMVAVMVNDEYVDVDYILKNKDRIKIEINDLAIGPKSEWIDKANTMYAKKMIKEFHSSIK